MVLIAKFLVALLGLSGFLLANYIRRSKSSTSPLVCPLEGSCETVIYSRYSKFLGIPLEYWGMSYYAIVFLFYLAFAVGALLDAPSLEKTLGQMGIAEIMPSAHLVVLGLTVIAFLFSLYLTTIQAIILKHWCTWCLISASICTCIFILVIMLTNGSIFLNLGAA